MKGTWARLAPFISAADSGSWYLYSDLLLLLICWKENIMGIPSSSLYFLSHCVQILLYLLRDIQTFLPSFIWKPLVPSMLNTSIVEMNKIKSPPSSSSYGNGMGRDHYTILYRKWSEELSKMKVKVKGTKSAEPEASTVQHVPSTVGLLCRGLGDRQTDSRWGWEGSQRPCMPC